MLKRLFARATPFTLGAVVQWFALVLLPAMVVPVFTSFSFRFVAIWSVVAATILMLIGDHDVTKDK